jgi:hypothetical protein
MFFKSLTVVIVSSPPAHGWPKTIRHRQGKVFLPMSSAMSSAMFLPAAPRCGATLAHNAHPHQLLQPGRRLLAAALSAGPQAARWRQQRQRRPAPALLARLPLGLHVALDLSLVGIRRWQIFGHPPHADGNEAPLPGRSVGLGHFRLFRMVYWPPPPASNKPYVGAFLAKLFQ